MTARPKGPSYWTRKLKTTASSDCPPLLAEFTEELVQGVIDGSTSPKSLSAVRNELTAIWRQTEDRHVSSYIGGYVNVLDALAAAQRNTRKPSPLRTQPISRQNSRLKPPHPRQLPRD